MGSKEPGVVKSLCLLAVCGLIASTVPAQAEPPPPTPTSTLAPPSATVPGVTVAAPSNLTPAQQVETLAQADGKGQLARWSSPVCPTAMGLPDEFNAFIVNRMREVAKRIGAKFGDGGCQANILVLVTRDPAAFTHRLVALKERALAGGRWPVDKIKLEAFANDTKPVRWLYMSDTVQSSGGDAGTSQTPHAAGVTNGNAVGAHGATGANGLEAFLGGGALPSAPQFGNVRPSRLTPTGEQAFSQIVIVVDADKIAGLGAGQLADYLSMVALAQVRSDATFVGVDTVLNLFSPDRDTAERPAGLTAWDLRYLTALYSSDSQTNYAAQVSHIATRMKAEQAATGAK
jgi:hypothetical protein